MRRRRRSSARVPVAGNRAAVVGVALGLVTFLVLLRPLGFATAASALFVLAANAFAPSSNRRQRLAFAIAVVFVVIVDLRSREGWICRSRAVLVRSPLRGSLAMDALSALLDGFRVALTPINLLWALAGVTLGTLVGVLPGIGPALTVALLLPVTFSLEPIEAFIMFAGIYYGGMYGGSTTAILLNTPGESASVMTAVEGHLMARAGRGGAALATAAIGSFVAGTLATAALTFSAPIMANAALRFGPAEYFALTLLAFVAVSSVLGESRLKGLASLFFGLVLGLIGIDPLTGEARLSFGIPSSSMVSTWSLSRSGCSRSASRCSPPRGSVSMPGTRSRCADRSG